MLWGGISGALAAWFTTPFDVIKTRVMTATELMTFSQALRSGCGAVGLLAGAGPRSAWWFCVSSVFFGTYERLRSSFQEKLESWPSNLNLAKRSDKRGRFGEAAVWTRWHDLWLNWDHGSPQCKLERTPVHRTLTRFLHCVSRSTSFSQILIGASDWWVAILGMVQPKLPSHKL